MCYVTGYFLDRGRQEDAAVILQKLKGKRGRQDVFLGVVCYVREAAPVKACLTKRFLTWFRTEALWICQKRSSDLLEQLEQSLAGLLKELPKGVSLADANRNMQLAGMICVGAQVVCFGRGGGGCFAIQKRFGKSILKELCSAVACWSWSGQMQNGSSILLATGKFHPFLTKQELEGVLCVEALSTEENMQRRLRELGILAAERSGVCQAIILCRYQENGAK